MLISLFSAGLNFGEFMAILVAYLFVLLISFSSHEFAHAFTAYKQGDSTAKLAGRMTLNPFAHFNLYGFVCLLIFGFGWASPVPVCEYNYRNGKKSMFAVAIAGILTNLVLALFFTFVYSLIGTFAPIALESSSFWSLLLQYFLVYGVEINLSLAFFNLLPFYPLDGSRLLELVLKPDNKFLQFMYKYSTIILILLLGFGIINFLLQYVLYFMELGMLTMWTSLFNLFK